MKKTSIALVILRYGFTAVFIWFGLSQLFNPALWVSFIPSWAMVFGLTAHTLVIVNGLAEVILAILLALDLWTPVVAFLLALHLLVIALDIGIDPIGVRDLGLTLALAALGFISWGERETEFN